MYKINLHSHTIFSDGANTPLGMALAASDMGLTALVITDHFYPTHSEEWCSMNLTKYKLAKKACREARKILPVIHGMELAFGKEEMLVFGSGMIQEIFRHCKNGGELTLPLLRKWKHKHDSAFILCHPHDKENWSKLITLLDGYEHYNAGQNMFPEGWELTPPATIPAWCNSDAHCVEGLSIGFNLVDSKITTESDLIRYIKRGKQPIHVVNGEVKVFNKGEMNELER